jgi:hypothetical protein
MTRTLNEGIWDDAWLGGYGTWVPLIVALAVCVAIWVTRRQRK